MLEGNTGIDWFLGSTEQQLEVLLEEPLQPMYSRKLFALYKKLVVGCLLQHCWRSAAAPGPVLVP